MRATIDGKLYDLETVTLSKIRAGDVVRWGATVYGADGFPVPHGVTQWRTVERVTVDAARRRRRLHFTDGCTMLPSGTSLKIQRRGAEVEQR